MALPDQPTLAQELSDLIQDNVLECPGGLTPQSDLFEHGLDSMAIMQLLLLIEEKYGFMPPASDLTRDNFTTPEDLARLLSERVVEQG